MDWTYLFDNQIVFRWVKDLVFPETLCDIEVAVAEVMSCSLGEDRVNEREPNCKNNRIHTI